MTNEQYNALEAHISYWGSLIAAIAIENVWMSVLFLFFAGVQMARQLYWYAQTFKGEQG
jgi:hypothetical protein